MRSRKLVLVSLSLTVLLVISFGAGIVVSWEQADGPGGTTRDDVDAVVSNGPAGPLMAIIKPAFPDDYNRLLDQLIVAINSGATDATVSKLGEDFTSTLRRRHAGNVASADLARLDRMIESH